MGALRVRCRAFQPSTRLYCPLEWVFRPTAPWEVMTIFDPDGTNIDWVFGRELLYDALVVGHAVGKGDVLLHRRGDLLVITLRTPDEVSVFTVSAGPVFEFMYKSLEIVPFGDEEFVTADYMDAAIAQLLITPSTNDEE